jgi:hypothetical protein
MKKTYTKIKVFAVALTMAAASMSAQLSGLYTINSASPTAANNFSTFTDFRNALVNQGVGGPVTVDVAPGSGPYVEQIDIPQIVGTSAVNGVTVNGNGRTLTFNSSNFALPHTLALSGADFFTFNNLVIAGTGPNAYVVHLWNDSDNNTFDNCDMNCPVGSTSSNQLPYSLSGSASSIFTIGNTGDNNLARNCRMRWGYTSAWLYGLSGAPFNTNNNVENCNFEDWYLYGGYIAFQRQSAFRNNIIRRLNLSNVTTTYGLFFTSSTYQCTASGNRIQQLFDNAPGAIATVYGIWFSAPSAAGFEHNCVNNFVKIDKGGAGTKFGIYLSNAQFSNVFHNTVAIEDNTGSYTTYGIWYSSTSTGVNIKNNVCYNRDNATGTRYGMYYSTNLPIGNDAGNVVFNQCPNATVWHGYANFTNQATQAIWQTVNGYGVNGYNTDPLFNNPGANDYSPASYVMNNGGVVLNVATDINGANRSLVTPDAGAWEYFNTPCFGTPPAASAITPTFVVCPNSVNNLFISPTYTTSGNTFQWQFSNISPVGPWTIAPTGTNAAFNATVGSQTLFYSAIVTCTNGNNSITTNAGTVNVASTTTNNVYYFEGFEGIAGTNRLPNCSWTSNNIGNTCFTYTSVLNQNRSPRTGSKYASFWFTPAFNNFFWTNGIWMEAGVTYSINTWYKTEANTNPTWQLNLWVSPSQSTVNAFVAATSGGPGSAADPSYKLLSNTYSVATTGFYHVGVNAISSGAGTGYLSWDDLEISVPCNLNPVPLVINNSGSSTVCAGAAVNLSATGADTYLWNNGSTSSNISVNPNFPTTYVVVGTSAISGCTTSASQFVMVNPSPAVGIFAPNTSVCAGSSVNITAFGASSYQWNTGATTNVLNVSPSAATSYTVIGTNSFGCTAQAVQAIGVNPLPSVGIASSDPDDIVCVEDVTTLTYNGAGAVTFQWISNNGVLVGNPVNVSPQSTTSYTLVGTSAAGCKSEGYYELNVTECVGLNQNAASVNGIKVFPNPNNGVFTIEWDNNLNKTATVTDVSGKVVYTAGSSSNQMNIDLGELSNGIYFVKVESNGVAEVIRVVKN